MKLTIVGGGGFRVPQIVEALARRPETEIDITELCLFDTDPQRSAVIGQVLDQLPSSRKPEVTISCDLTAAVKGADFVFSAIRVGGTEGRVMDELIPLSHHVLGQETVGPGGYAYAMRTIPEALRLAQAVREHAPGAWVINFTNPAGIITQAMRAEMGDRVIGICDTPIGLVRRAARAVGQPESELDYDYIGLNHLGWLRSLSKGDEQLLPKLLGDGQMLGEIEEARLIGFDWVRALGMLPNEYLFYFYRNREAVQEILRADATRGQFLSRQQRDFYRAALAEPARAGTHWNAAHEEREASYMAEAREVAQDGERRPDDLDGGYQEVALDLMTALSGGKDARMILGVRNAESGKRIVDSLADDAVIEVPCRVNRAGVAPVDLAPLTGPELGLVVQIKACETLVIEAVRDRDKTKGWRAIASHPLVDSVEVARAIFTEYCEAIPEVGAIFD